MSVKVQPPPIRVPIVDGNGRPTPAFSDFITRLWDRTGGNIDSITDNDESQSSDRAPPPDVSEALKALDALPPLMPDPPTDILPPAPADFAAAIAAQSDALAAMMRAYVDEAVSRCLDDLALAASPALGTLGTLAAQNAENAQLGRLWLRAGADQPMSTATLVAGTVTVASPLVTINSHIFLTPRGTTAGTPGSVSVSSRVAGTSFTITSTSATDTRLVAWMIVEPF